MKLIGPISIPRIRSEDISNVLMKQENVLLKTHLWCQLGEITQKGWGSIFVDTVFQVNHQNVYGTASQIARMHGS